MKKVIAFMLAAIMLLSLCACGSSESSGGTASGKSFDTGYFTLTVPDGWLAIVGKDLDGNVTPKSLTLIKDGKDDWDTLDHAFIKIDLYDKDGLWSAKGWLDDVKDLDPVEISGFTCEHYTYTSGSFPYDALEGKGATNDISVTMLTENSGKKIAFKDADVQLILNSIVVTGEAAASETDE